MNVFGRTILLLTALLSMPLAQALSLGDIAGTGAIGERLDAYVPVYLAPAERASLHTVDVLPDLFEREGSTPVSTLHAALEFNGNRAYVHVTSSGPITVERLAFRLRVHTTRGAVLARYTLRVKSAQRADTNAPSVRADNTRIVARRSAIVAAPKSAQAGAGRYGPVRAGESLWTIAEQYARPGDVQSTIRALHALNPAAFIGGDMNRLRAGVTLTLPDSISAQRALAVQSSTATRADAATTTRTVTSNEDPSQATTPGPGIATQDDLEVLLNDDASSAKSLSASTVVTAVLSDARARDAAITQRLAELDAKFAAIRLKYGATPTTDTKAVLGPVESAPPVHVGSPGVVPAAAATPPKHIMQDESVSTQQHPVSTKAAAPPAPLVAVATPVDSLPRWIPRAGLALLLTIGAVAMLPMLRRRAVSLRTQASVATVKATDADRKAEVTRKAESRVRLESEIQGLLKRKAAAPAPITAASPLTDTTHPPLSPLEQTFDALAETHGGGALIENDREVAIDANIAHGRYAKAEALLREVIGANPRNVQAKLRLAEVYYITEKLEGFAAVAIDIKDNHRPDMTDDEWQRLVRMGKIIAPDLALFSGPKSVGKRA